ncbi:TlpA family protein disulfide reductase [Caldimonas tepidiphila]|uniref:TlpA family protein disulfide reductase n=1 Tax=Caldimonas tepidiphila TaxID=2315841 RepID=UPI0013003D74|nr:TlpA disulfide reductase family protein [Caldimonas tepidiphila]
MKASPPPNRGLPRRRLLQAVTAAATLAWLPGRAAQPRHRVRPWPAGQAVPPLSLPVLEGGRWSLADARGQAVLLNFWASWCEPCVAEMPSLQRLAQGHAGRLEVRGVNFRESPERVRAFLQQVGTDFPQLLDSDGAAMRAWTPRVLPSTVLVDAQGRPRFTVVGELDWDGDEAQRLLEPWLSGKPHR